MNITTFSALAVFLIGSTASFAHQAPAQYQPHPGLGSPYGWAVPPTPTKGEVAAREIPADKPINGRYELSAGFVDVPATSGYYRGGATLASSGEGLGGQVDLGIVSDARGKSYGATFHAFNRDTTDYSGGFAAGIVRSDAGANLYAIGPEMAAYLDRFTIEAWIGLAMIDYDSPALKGIDGVFVLGDVAYYPTDDLKLSIGGTQMFGVGSLELKSEYRFEALDLPLSATADLRYDDEGGLRITAGFKGYIGGDSDKSLIERHRQDIQPSRVFDMVAGSGSLMHAAPPTIAPPVPPAPPVVVPPPEVVDPPEVVEPPVVVDPPEEPEEPPVDPEEPEEPELPPQEPECPPGFYFDPGPGICRPFAVPV